MNDGNIGIGTDEPTASLHIAGQIAPLRIENLEQGDIDFDDLLVTDKDGVVKNIGNLTDLFAAFSIPTPAVFSLNTSITNFLNGYNSGAKQTIPMVEVNNSIKGLKFNKSTNTITLPRGTYQFSLIYEATHPACTISSYCMDFPMGASSVSRVHSTASHKNGANASQHGGTITYVTHLPNERNFTIALGRGASGDCTGTGMTLIKNSTVFLVYKIGD